MSRCAALHRFPMMGPEDVSSIEVAITAGKIKPDSIVAILGKTEGNGCVNDFTRGYAVQSLSKMLERYLTDTQIHAIPMIMSGGTEGGLSPHWIVLQEVCDTAFGGSDTQAQGSALAFSSAVTRELSPDEIGRVKQSILVRDAVHRAMQEASISSPSDVHFVQIKCPLMTAERARTVNGDVSTADTLLSMGLSRGASALGVALALDEVQHDQVTNQSIGSDLSLWSACASCSAGIELMHCEIVVMGQSESWAGPFRIAHCVMQDAIDAPVVNNLLVEAFNDRCLQQSSHSIHAVLAKAEAAKSGTIRGNRHCMLADSDISSTRHARAFVGGLLAGLVGHTELFVSGGAEHQGPDGGGPVSIIYS